ncbi:MAG: bifunctional UDP-N-acetylglucosamine diphosphorylase/glucosamine-1-phosphate N-acetyltransferase GlmU [Pseudomonadales bacterium]|nr:bifunctional UDP-N-acetylglucosamine diphosphorylase/glucosamine-1-phosphate N-acetyltransferase GlmU [Gammaproteobacteria bacterium]MBP6053875.1 bifunctional UDP-N-acetylglucosamine diphosphorylase/glucosamine-1-phosphate N-acetyltransferase GlmU [Pseudomonadales bacterium]MBP6229625.1 bifunctional UDP-N-acetylglucosamine diphosphorylase/glucosamine-1-phosphate N-acetyltransferase GlmU [Pseudomonadales bacterium]
MPLEIVILAAGQGTRMVSDLPKVLHRLAGRALLQHVADTAALLGPQNLHIVIGHGAEQVRTALATSDAHWVVQERQLGTGHAVQQALPGLADGGITLILYGDVPLVRESTLRELVAIAEEGALALLTVELADPSGYGRIRRDEHGRVAAIVEHKDASSAERAICEVNTGIMAMPTAQLRNWLGRLGNNNAQGEYYLTDIIALAAGDGVIVQPLAAASEEEVAGVNDRQQLAMLERSYQRRKARALMLAGLTLVDPARFDLRGSLRHGRDTVIDINVIIEGDVVLGNRVRVGANCVLRNARIADGAIIHENSVIEDADVGPACSVGPFARLRPGTRMADGAKIGNFVETKKARIGAHSKISHLSYVGDAVLGENVNVGAGTITCNYDGVNKFQTVIGDGAFIGSNTALVAPVEVGRYATVGAGSVVTTAVPDEALAVARGKQRNIERWQRPARKSRDQ